MKTKVLIAIVALVIIVAAIVGIFAFNYQDIWGSEDSINETKITSNATNSSSGLNGPKNGYALMKLAGLNFYGPDKYLDKYKSGDYFDAFKGGKDYQKTLDDPEYAIPLGLDCARLTFIQDYGKEKTIEDDEDDGYFIEYPNQKIYGIYIYPKDRYPSDFDSLGIYNKNGNLNRTIETKYVNGNKIRIIKTGSAFDSLDIGPNEVYVYFEVKDKSIEIAFTGVPIDYYLINSFFSLN